MRNELTQERLRELLHYDPNTGEFLRLKRAGRNGAPGRIAGSPDRKGHILITIDQCRYSAHRLAWFYVTGSWPNGQIDHINGLPDDNRILNLRDVSHAENQHNIRCAKAHNKSSGLLGVRKSASKKNPWQACIHANGKFHHIGLYKTPQEAHLAYIDAKRQLHEGNTL